MVRSFVIAFLVVTVGLAAFAQPPEGKFTVFSGKGQASSIDEIMKSLENADVVFLGEFHDDAVAHAIQFEIFKRAIEQYGAKRKVTLSLEMFERDVQTVVNEYLAGQISENHFLLSSRPWPRYKEDYRPLVELAKEKKLQVIAANAPRRYVNMVSRNGRDSVNALSKQAKAWLAPLPYAEASEAYSKKFKALMGSSAEASMGIDKILSSQSLWDATMAHSVAESLKKNKGSLVVHLNGGFHTEMRLGTVEHFLKYRKNGRAVVVTMRYEDDFKKFDAAKHADAGDFVVLTQRPPRGVISQILQRMTTHAQTLKTLRADITIRSYNPQINETDEWLGKVTYLPAKGQSGQALRVDFEKPVAEQLAIIRDQFALYRPRQKLAMTGKVSKVEKDLPFAIIYGITGLSSIQLRTNFEVAYLAETTIADNTKTWLLRLTPKAKEEYKSFDLWIDADGLPRQILLRFNNGDTVTAQLSNIQKDTLVSADLFELKFPQGTRVIKP